MLKRIKELENRHVAAKDVKLDVQMVQKFEKAKIQAKEEENHQKMHLIKKTFYDIEADE